MKSNQLDFRNFNLMAHQWVLGQYEYFDTIQDAECVGEHKMPECDFVDHIMDSFEQYMPKFVGIYRQDEVLGKPWSSSLLKTHISHRASKSKGQLGIEKEAGQQNEIATNMLRQNHHDATSHGINDDDSRHQYDQPRSVLGRRDCR
jgi:hypothetical protein